ncbi:3-deoxy-7-phosphoheptulonate synthase [Myxococcota bacterium]|nr:3-deoxy-7-phosphoheptulonate synthase [Myxococcota bacterium]MBU1535121.1 3-deoxy-7-phosphoheptulonate synthase [Myxococcota bacterium]
MENRDLLLFSPKTPIHIAGPCSVESAEQIEETAAFLSKFGVPVLRGGTFKARTFSSSFQGLGEEGILMLARAAHHNGMACVTEVMNEDQLAFALPHVDMVQVGARSMFNYPLLTAIGKAGIPVILKRGMGATIDEWLAASEYIATEGNPNIILCERGIRSFETATRFTLDVAAIPIARRRSVFPVIVDPSHAAGESSLVFPLARAAMAAGASGIMVEVHPDPLLALSDGKQSLDFQSFELLHRELTAVCNALESLK